MPKDVIDAVPAQRSRDLVVRRQGEETLVLDTRNDAAHCLPGEVTRVWDACAPGRTLADIAAAAGVDDIVAASSVAQLSDLNLLERPATGIDRRKFLLRVAVSGATVAALPLVQSIIAPAVTAAATVVPPTCHAMIDQQTCSGSAHKADYFLTVSGLAGSTSYNVVVTYKNGTVSDTFGITTDPSGVSTSGPHQTGASIPQGGVQDVKIQVFTLSGTLVCQDTGLAFTRC